MRTTRETTRAPHQLLSRRDRAVARHPRPGRPKLSRTSQRWALTALRTPTARRLQMSPEPRPLGQRLPGPSPKVTGALPTLP